MYEENFPQRLRKAREDAGYKQKEVANEIGLTEATISKYENGKLQPDLERLAALAEFLNVTTDWLLGIGKKEPQK